MDRPMITDRDAVTTGAAGSTANAAARVDLVDLRDVTVDFKTGGGWFGGKQGIVRAVDHVDLAVGQGETLGLVGGTGSGKSTIAHLVMGMEEPTGGKILVAGQEPRVLRGRALLEHRRRVQVVLQDPYSSLDPRMKVRDIIAEPLTLGHAMGKRSSEITRRVEELLGLVGLSPSKAGFYPHQFSGGQRQRIAIARALAPEPQIIVLDEPTSALDVSVRAQILNLLKGLQSKLGITYLVISHDLVSVAYLASTVAVMYYGRIVEIAPTRTIYSSARHPYTMLLHESAPSADGAFLKVLQPQVLAPRADGAWAESDGCRYASRCGLRLRLVDHALCDEKDPALHAVGPDHLVACHFAEQAAELVQTPEQETAGGLLAPVPVVTESLEGTIE
jgi:oligopeptide/dipeptide ABC transporter ATP-binding protein